jgi:hypothetical protein
LGLPGETVCAGSQIGHISGTITRVTLDDFGGASVVAGDHNDPEAEPSKGGDRSGRIVLDRVGHREDARRR